MAEFPFQMLSPEKVLYQGKITSLVAPGVEGYLGVMAGHAPMLAALTLGEVKITEPDKAPVFFAITGGFLEVGPDEVVLMADAAEKAEEIDVTRAEAAKERADARLTQRKEDVDVDRARAALMRALNRLRVASHSGR